MRDIPPISINVDVRQPLFDVIRRRIPRSVAWLLLALSSYWAARLAWADHLSRDSQPEIRERALRLAPAVALFAERLADRREDLFSDSLADRRRAAELDPENADRLMQLGLRAELAGDDQLAEKSLLGAAKRSRLYQPKYLLAQYYFRRGEASRFWDWARSALETAYGDASPLFDLCWRMRPDAAWLSSHVLPRRPAISRQFLTFLLEREQWEPALAEARKIAEIAQAEDRAALLDYCDARLARASATDSREIWNSLCQRRLLPDEPLDRAHDRLLTNGEFSHSPSARGFDWRLVEQSGVRCVVGDGQMRVEFSGRQPERCPIAWQYVPLEPGRLYRLRYEVRAGDPGANRGLRWEVPDASVQFEPGSALFSTRREVARVVLVYERPMGSPRLEGPVAVTHVRLERIH